VLIINVNQKSHLCLLFYLRLISWLGLLPDPSAKQVPISFMTTVATKSSVMTRSLFPRNQGPAREQHHGITLPRGVNRCVLSFNCEWRVTSFWYLFSLFLSAASFSFLRGGCTHILISENESIQFYQKPFSYFFYSMLQQFWIFDT